MPQAPTGRLHVLIDNLGRISSTSVIMTASSLRAETGLLPLCKHGTGPGTPLVPAEYFMMKKRGSVAYHVTTGSEKD